MNTFGLKENEIQLLRSIFAQYEAVSTVLVYGSRAKGTFNERSDLDLVVLDSVVDRHTIGQVLLDVNNSNFPYLVDLQDINTIKNPNLIEHINRIGQILFERTVE